MGLRRTEAVDQGIDQNHSWPRMPLHTAGSRPEVEGVIEPQFTSLRQPVVEEVIAAIDALGDAREALSVDFVKQLLCLTGRRF